MMMITIVSIKRGGDDVSSGRVKHRLLTGVVHDSIQFERPVHLLVVHDAFLRVSTAVNVHRLQTAPTFLSFLLFFCST